jgi:hypothetical protein
MDMQQGGRMFERDAESRLERAKHSVAAGASHVQEKTKEVLSGAKERAGDVVRFVRESEPDHELEQRTRAGTERGLNRAGEAVAGAAPAIGRGAEYAAGKVGGFLKFAARPIGAIVGPIAGVVGGWWKSARDSRADMPSADEEACRIHFAALAVHGLTFDAARSGYAIGYLAGCNPDYRGRSFEEVEPDLRHGFSDDAGDYEQLREFARFGYGRGPNTRGLT